MPLNIGELIAKISADTTGLDVGIRKSRNAIRRAGRNMSKDFRMVRKSVFSLQSSIVALAGAYGVGRLSKSFLDAAKATESYQVRLKALLGSTEEGNRLFKEMAEFAGQVPFEYNKIMESATALSGVMRGGTDEIRAWMPMIADLAAVSGISIEQTTQQVIRMYSAGAASADLFRERGILAMLGFQAGVSYSAEETKERMIEAWTSASSSFRGVTKDLAKTWQGQTSMMADAWFQFRDDVMRSGLFDFLKAGMALILDEVNRLRKEGTLKKWAKEVSDSALNLFESVAIGTAGLLDTSSKYMRAIWNEASNLWKAFRKLPPWVQEIGIVGAVVGGTKGKILLLASIKLIEALQNSVEGVNQVMKGNIELSDLATMNAKELKKTLEGMQRIKGFDWGGIEEGTVLWGKYNEEARKALSGIKEETSFDIPKLVEDTGKYETLIIETFKRVRKKIEEMRREVGGGGLTPDFSALQTGVQNFTSAEWEKTGVYGAEIEKRLEMAKEWADEDFKIKQDLAQANYVVAADLAAKELQLTLQYAADRGKALANMKSDLTTVLTWMAEKHKSAFKILKVIKIAETIIDTYRAAQGAYAALADIPKVGPYLAAAAAAVAIAAGVARVAKIKSTTWSSSSVSATSTGTPSVSAPTAPSVPSIPDIGEEGVEERPSLTIIIEGDFIGDESYIDTLIERINEAVEDRDVALIATTSENAEVLL